MKTSIIKLPELIRSWRKAEWPRSTGPHDPLRGVEMPIAEQAPGQEWEAEGGAVRVSAITPVPKIPV